MHRRERGRRAAPLNLPGAHGLVTGASSGIGAATARLLARDGVRLTLAGRDDTRLAALARATGGTPLAADLAVSAGRGAVCQRAGDVDLLVHSAGRGWAGPIERMTDELIDEIVTLNLTAAAHLVRAVLPGMRERGSGHIVLVASIAAVGVENEAVYSATKAGLRALANAVRHEAADAGIGVSTVLPGAVDTPFFGPRGQPYDRRFPRPVTAERVASAIVDAVRTGKSEVFVPRWLALASGINGAAPALFHRLSGRFG